MKYVGRGLRDMMSVMSMTGMMSLGLGGGACSLLFDPGALSNGGAVGGDGSTSWDDGGASSRDGAMLPNDSGDLKVVGSRKTLHVEPTRSLHADSPTGVRTGDLLVAVWIVAGQTGGFVTPEGWTSFGAASAGDALAVATIWVGSHVLTEHESDATSWTLETTVTAGQAAVILAFRAAAPAIDPAAVGHVGGVLDADIATIVVPSVTAKGRSVGLFIVCVAEGTTLPEVAGFQRIEWDQGFAFYRSTAIVPDQTTIPGPVLSFSVTRSASATAAVASLGLRTATR